MGPKNPILVIKAPILHFADLSLSVEKVRMIQGLSRVPIGLLGISSGSRFYGLWLCIQSYSLQARLHDVQGLGGLRLTRAR